MVKNIRQKPHYRRSVKGKKFVAGRGKRKVKKARKTVSTQECPKSMQIQIIQENYDNIAQTLNKKGRVRIADLGVLSVQTKKATKARMMDNPFKPGEKWKVKAKPKRRLVKFRASKPLMRRI